MMRHFLALFLVFPSMLSIAIAQTDFDMSGMDRGVRPQDDLFEHVNGTWLQTTDIPADKSNFGSFIELDDNAVEHIHTLIEGLAKSEAKTDSDEQKIGDFYRSFMDTATIEQRGISPLKLELEAIDALKTHQEVFQHFAHLQLLGVSTPVRFFVDQDAKDSKRYLSQLIQSGTTLPDRDYYLNDDDNSKNIRDALRTYILHVCAIFNFGMSVQAAEQILELETKLAEAQLPREELRNAEKRYNPFKLTELNRITSDCDWKSYLETVIDGDVAVETINVNTPAFFDSLNGILVETPVIHWKNYLRFQLVDAFAPILHQQLVDAHFGLHSKAIAGIEEQLPRWKRAVNAISGGGGGSFGALGDVVGRLYVAEHFPPDAKAAMDELVHNLLKSFGSSIDDLTWMTDETKQRAREKLSKITTKIGYTDKWREYDELEVVPDDLFANTVNSNRVEFKRMTDKLGQPVDRGEWGMTPQTVNAYYNPSLNEIVFPAAILQSPFFSKDADPALNYGGIGAVIGHEISHAFDDQGSKYDGEGNLNNWWTDEDRDAFQKLVERLIAQYADYQPLEGQFVNGKLTLGENIADLSGLSIAHRAYRMSLGGTEPEKVAGWSGDQLFFVGWSRVWRRKYRDAEMVKRLLTDPHSPSQYRTNGPVANISAFYQAFDVKEGDLLFKPEEERIEIW